MFSGVFKSKIRKVSLLALTLALLVAVAGTVGAIRPLNVFAAAASTDTCGYNPAASPAPTPPGGTVVFDENTVTRAIQFYGSGLSGHVGVFANDESGLNIGAGGTPSSSAGSSIGTAGTLASGTTVTSIPVPAGTSVAVSSGDSITVTQSGKTVTFTASANAAAGATSIPVNSKSVGSTTLTGGNVADTSIVWGQAIPPTFGSGVDGQLRPVAPTIYLTDITANASSKAGDWQSGGQSASSNGADGLFGSWTATTGTKPVNTNNWVLGPNADPIPATDAFGGTTTSFNEGYGTEVTWNVANLKAYDPTTNTLVALQPGHTYRVQSMTHDGDQNHTSGGGDVGEVCTTFHIPAPNLTITKTADTSPVNAGDTIGFTVEIKNTGDAAASGASLNDPLPAGSGTGVTWAIDTTTGTPAKFSLTGAAGSQKLGLASSAIPPGADYTVHITAATAASECGVYDNTATLTSTDSNPPPASAEEVCNPAHVVITKTADAASVNAGDQIGFTVEVKNTGTGLAKGVSLSDPLPAGSGTGVTWAVDNSTGTPAQFSLSGAKGSQMLSLVPSTLAAGADYTVHITATTSFAECSKYDNTATVTTTNANNPPGAEAVVTCNPSAIHILKTPDAAQVNAGDQIGFTLTVWNSGAGDAVGTKLSDPLPTNAGLNWTIAGQGAGWNSTCAIAAGSLTCGGVNGVTVPAGTTQAASTFTVHITSTTTSATGGTCPGGSGVVDNTGNVTTTNGGSDQSNAKTCVAAPDIQIAKTADAAQVNAGDQIGFTVTVYNTGVGDAYGVKMTDPLPTNAGLNWTIESQGAGWNSTCAIAAGSLTCGGTSGVTVPANTTKAASTFTVHITSTTTSATGGTCPGGTGVVDNTGNVTTTNDGSGQASASTCVAAPSIEIAKTADAAQVNAGDQIGFTVTVYNTGSGDAYGVKMTDPLPTNAGLNWTIESQGAGWNSTCAIAAGSLTCGGANGVTVPANTTKAASTFTVHITSTTTAATGGTCPGGTGVVDNTGNVTTTNDGSGQANASTCVAAPSIQIAKTADAAQVNAGDQIGFTVTVYNTGVGDAYGVNLSDPLPTNAGLNWTIESQGAGWGGSCAIALGTLKCGPATVPAGTTLAGSSFTVHITSTTTAATGGVCPGGSGVVDNTGSVTTTNDGSGQANAKTCVAAPDIQIAKTADAAQVNEGDQIGFTVTVYNIGSGDAYGVKMSDPLPTNTGLSWSIESQGAGWGGTCAIAAGTLTCGGVNGATVPAGTTQAASTFTVHIISGTGPGTGGACPTTGVVDNTGSVTTTNDGSGQASAQTCVEGITDLSITKTGSPATQNQNPPYQNITWTMVVTNNGPDTDTNVQISDPMPAGNTYVSHTTTKGTCTGGAILTCDLGTMLKDDTVTITLVTKPTLTGEQINTVVVTGDLPESDTTNNTATATVLIAGPHIPPCTAVAVLPKQLYVGRVTKVHIKVTQNHKAVKGVRVQIKGPGVHVTTAKSNAKGKVSQRIKPKKAGIVTFKPIVTSGSACKVPRVGVTGVFTPPVTG
jgi:uncharacterized repeat protein (TIGR01451 family)